MFVLHPHLKEKSFVYDFPLSTLLLENDKNYLWLFLVPRRPNISKIMDLTKEDQLQLLEELDCTQKLLWKNFQPEQLNVAAIGNKTAQLHIHVIARSTKDPAWPHTVWDHPVRTPYDEEEKKHLIRLLQKLLHSSFIQ